MAFGVDVDTLNLTFDKLQYIFNGYDAIRDSFLEIDALHKQGNIVDYEFFDKIQESIMRFSALEFLAIKSIFEIKKALYRSMEISIRDDMPSDLSNSIHPSGHSVSTFIVRSTLPSSGSQILPNKAESRNCPQCGSLIRRSSKFCINCGNKI